MAQIPTKWLRFDLQTTESEDQTYLLFELGAAGVVTQLGHIEAFFQDNGNSDNLKISIEQLGFGVIRCHLVADENWVSKCGEILKPQAINGLEIIPVTEASLVMPKDHAANKIFIIPGLGFGTGHHPTTGLILKVLQEIKQQGACPENALDLGTGSGILAIAIQRIFGIEVDAFDIDPLALENAADNANLNHCTEQIHFKHSSIDGVTRKYSLITANIYAEVLCNFRNEFSRCLQKGGRLVMSGIMESLGPSVEMAFSGPDFELLAKVSNQGWLALDYKFLGL